MHKRSALADLQKLTTVSLLALAAAWLAWFWQTSPGWAMTGALGILFIHAFVLAAEFIALYVVGAGVDAATPRPTALQLLRAWGGETLMALRVFCWRQPFRWREIPDNLDAESLAGRRGVVLIHGFVCNRGFWTPWLKLLRARHHAFVAVNLEPVFGSISGYIPIIEDAVQRVTGATGLPPLLVCHSMGGLAARAWLQDQQGHQRILHVVTIASPHHGTWLARFSHLTNGRQMRQGSGWLAALERGAGGQPHTGFTCWYTNCDNIVFPAATATLPGADNRLLCGVAHVDLAFEPEVMETTLRRLAG
jgi:triacylglycerol lipase